MERSHFLPPCAQFPFLLGTGPAGRSSGIMWCGGGPCSAPGRGRAAAPRSPRPSAARGQAPLGGGCAPRPRAGLRRCAIVSGFSPRLRHLRFKAVSARPEGMRRSSVFEKRQQAEQGGTAVLCPQSVSRCFSYQPWGPSVSGKLSTQAEAKLSHLAMDENHPTV